MPTLTTGDDSRRMSKAVEAVMNSPKRVSSSLRDENFFSCQHCLRVLRGPISLNTESTEMLCALRVNARETQRTQSSPARGRARRRLALWRAALAPTLPTPRSFRAAMSRKDQTPARASSIRGPLFQPPGSWQSAPRPGKCYDPCPRPTLPR